MRDRGLLVLDAVLGLFLGPVAFYFALESLSVISQTLLFALVLPVSALLARRLLDEALPRGFWSSFGLIGLGLLLPPLAAAGGGGGMNELRGVAWALVGVMAFAGAGVSGRAIAGRGWPLALTVGLTTTVSALVFGLIAVVLFGPRHFHLLSAWWVVGVILIYGVGLSLGSEVALRRSYRHWSVAQVSLWGSLSIVVAVVSAALLLAEPISPATLAGLLLLLLGTSWGRWSGRAAPRA
jgi:drug/metabolite transporter (DMT)-like permease